MPDQIISAALFPVCVWNHGITNEASHISVFLYPFLEVLWFLSGESVRV